MLYVGSYVVNSSRGGYWTSPEHFGQTKAVHYDNAVRWQPFRGYLSPRKSDSLGMFYSPLIGLDRKLVHPTHLIKLSRSNTWLTEMSLSDIHPQCRTNLWWKKDSDDKGH